MPRTRLDLDRDEKVSQILDVAVQQLQEAGLAGLSVAAIARELGIGHNAVRWYFPSRDELLVAAVRRLLEQLVARKPPAARGARQQVAWFVDELHQHAALRSAIQERAHSSPAVASFVQEFHELLRGLAAIWLTGDRSKRSVQVDAFLAAIEGALLIENRRQRAEVVKCAYDAFAARGAAPSPRGRATT